MTLPAILDPATSDSTFLAQVADHLDAGGLLAYPTETVYGLGAAGNREGARAVSALKGRAPDRPFVLLLPDARLDHPGDPSGWGLEWSSAARRLAESLWPGPLTLVLPDREGRFPSAVRGRGGGVAVRVSSHPFVQALLSRWRHPLLSTSANPTGEAPARTAGEVSERMAGRPHAERLWVVDGGQVGPGPASTVVDCTGARPRVLREGAVSLARLREIVPHIGFEEDD